jgi:hypothetical protein
MTVGVYLDELDRVVGGERLLTMSLRRLEDPRYGGEWDWRRNMDRRTHRRLAGAGWLSSQGEKPDTFADFIIARVPDVDDTCSAIDWYLRMASRSIREARRESHQHRHLRFARQQGHATYYAYRRALALEHGHGSLWHMRKDRGWQ